MNSVWKNVKLESRIKNGGFSCEMSQAFRTFVAILGEYIPFLSKRKKGNKE